MFIIHIYIKSITREIRERGPKNRGEKTNNNKMVGRNSTILIIRLNVNGLKGRGYQIASNLKRLSSRIFQSTHFNNKNTVSL